MVSPPASVYCALEGLPSIVLDGVCEHLAVAGKLGRRGLFALSSTSKKLSIATSRFRLHTIYLEIQDGAKLRQDLEEWWRLFQASDRARCVRRLEIRGYMSLDGEQRRPVWNSDPDDALCNDGVWEGNDDFWALRPLKAAAFLPFDKVPTEEEKKASGKEAWSPLVNFIPNFTCLGDVVYACGTQIPASLLSALNSHPQCVRLHVHTFSLRSLYQPRTQLHDIDADEYFLATSPCLTSVRAVDSSSEYTSNGYPSFNREALLRMAAGLAPGLKSVSVTWKSPSATLDHANAIFHPKPTWPGFFHGDPPPSSNTTQTRKGTLEALALGGNRTMSSLTITDWHSHVDFGALRSLHLWSLGTHLSALQALSAISRAEGFKSLRCLSMLLYVAESHEQDQFDGAVAEVLASLPQLTQLSLDGVFAAETFSVILRCHGRSLRGLRLKQARGSELGDGEPFVLTCSHVEALVEACLGLEDLELLIPRSQGNEDEARIYGAIGKLRQLDRVSLLLDCSKPYVDGDSDDECEDESTRQLGHHSKYFRETFINAAVDSHLAEDIFHRVSSHGTHGTPRALKVLPVFVGECQRPMWLDGEFELIANCLKSGWVKVRNEMPGHDKEFHLTELGAAKRQAAEEILKGGVDPSYEPIIRSIWPDAKANTKAEWKSFPLWKG